MHPLTEFFKLEHELDSLETPESTEREHFNEAYILLQMRAATGESLREILTFWEDIITNKNLQEAA